MNNIIQWPEWKSNPQVQNGHGILSATRLPISPPSRFPYYSHEPQRKNEKKENNSLVKHIKKRTNKNCGDGENQTLVHTIEKSNYPHAVPDGLEPPTITLTACRSNQLSYRTRYSCSPSDHHPFGDG